MVENKTVPYFYGTLYIVPWKRVFMTLFGDRSKDNGIIRIGEVNKCMLKDIKTKNISENLEMAT